MIELLLLLASFLYIDVVDCAYGDRTFMPVSATLHVSVQVSWFFVKEDRDHNDQDISFGFKNLVFNLPHRKYAVRMNCFDGCSVAVAKQRFCCLLNLPIVSYISLSLESIFISNNRIYNIFI
jgi:hypothetical protein